MAAISLSPEQLVDVVTNKEQYGYASYPLFDIENYSQEELKDLVLQTAVFLVLGEDGKHLALAVLGNSAVRDNQFYLQHASGIGTSTHLNRETDLTKPEEHRTIRTLLSLGQQYWLPLAMLIFLE